MAAIGLLVGCGSDAPTPLAQEVVPGFDLTPSIAVPTSTTTPITTAPTVTDPAPTSTSSDSAPATTDRADRIVIDPVTDAPYFFDALWSSKGNTAMNECLHRVNPYSSQVVDHLRRGMEEAPEAACTYCDETLAELLVASKQRPDLILAVSGVTQGIGLMWIEFANDGSVDDATIEAYDAAVDRLLAATGEYT